MGTPIRTQAHKPNPDPISMAMTITRLVALAIFVSEEVFECDKPLPLAASDT